MILMGSLAEREVSFVRKMQGGSRAGDKIYRPAWKGEPMEREKLAEARQKSSLEIEYEEIFGSWLSAHHEEAAEDDGWFHELSAYQRPTVTYATGVM